MTQGKAEKRIKGDMLKTVKKVPRQVRRRTLLTFVPLGALLSGCEKEAFACDSPVALGEEDKASRRRVDYTDHSPSPTTKCGDCIQFEPGARCGTCKVLAGSIHPEGSCKIFQKRG